MLGRIASDFDKEPWFQRVATVACTKIKIVYYAAVYPCSTILVANMRGHNVTSLLQQLTRPLVQ